MESILFSKIPLFNSIPAQELEQIFSTLHLTVSTFRKDDLLALQDEPCNRLIILLAGSVKGEMIDPSGRMIRVEDIEAPNPLAILFLFGPSNRFPVQVTAREDVKALVIPKQAVLRMLSMNEALLKNYLDLSATFASRLSQKLHFMTFRTIRQKLAVYILNLSKQSQSDTVTLDKPKSALAEYFGVSRPSLERELTRMKEDGLLELHKKNVEIKNRKELTRLILQG